MATEDWPERVVFRIGRDGYQTTWSRPLPTKALVGQTRTYIPEGEVSEDSVRVKRADLVYVEACLHDIERGPHSDLTEADVWEFARSALNRIRAALTDQGKGDG